jgi:hypothetical protein
LEQRDVLARFKTTSCDECALPIRWWNRRVWALDHERCTHLQCWNGQLLLKTYVQLMSEEIRHSTEEIRHSTQASDQPSDNDSTDAALSELRASARALRERVERIEAQLQQAEEVAARMRVNRARKNGKLSTPASRMSIKGH